MPEPRHLGSEFENRAADYLLTLGWTLLGRRLKMVHGEIDIAAMDGEVLVIVEVKVRRRGNAMESLTPRKADRLMLAAGEFVEKFGLSNDLPIRFDAVLFEGERMTHHNDVLRSS